MKNLSEQFRERLRYGGTLAYFLRLALDDGTGRVLGYSSFDKSLYFAGVSFQPNNGIIPSAFQNSTRSEVGNTDVKLFFHEDISEQAVIQGSLNNAVATWFLADWTMPPEDIDKKTDADCIVLSKGRLGKIKGSNLDFSAEILTIEATLGQSREPVTTPLCRATLGDNDCQATVLSFDASVAQIDGLLVTLTPDNPALPAVVNDYCTNGRALWFNSNNHLLRSKIIRHTNNATTGVQILLAATPYGEVFPGDRLIVFGGCNHTIKQCHERFNNAINFRGEPHLPGPDALIKSP